MTSRVATQLIEPTAAVAGDALDAKHVRVLTAIAIALFGAAVIRTAWLCDDAYINFRTIDNFLHGYGLRWNVDERVQTFTDPLWVIIITALSAITSDFYYTVMALSLLLSLGTVLMIARVTARDAIAALGAAAPLLCSKSFVDFSTSGLENPLLHLLLVLFFTVYWRSNGSAARKLSLLASL